MERKGFRLHILARRHFRAHGISNHYEWVTVVNGLPEMLRVHPVADDAPPVDLLHPGGSIIHPDSTEHVYARPHAPAPHGHTPYMPSGAFIWSNDHRWTRHHPHPIPLHDRSETWAQYDALST